jgi:6,7-dimethyl-8-ribityllumazine synthase
MMVGGNCGVYEGTIVRERAVLATGTILTGSTPVYDLIRNQIYQRKTDAPLLRFLPVLLSFLAPGNSERTGEELGTFTLCGRHS